MFDQIVIPTRVQTGTRQVILTTYKYIQWATIGKMCFDLLVTTYFAAWNTYFFQSTTGETTKKEYSFFYLWP